LAAQQFTLQFSFFIQQNLTGTFKIRITLCCGSSTLYLHRHFQMEVAQYYIFILVIKKNLQYFTVIVFPGKFFHKGRAVTESALPAVPPVQGLKPPSRYSAFRLPDY
jgi:hypothetical protein